MTDRRGPASVVGALFDDGLRDLAVVDAVTRSTAGVDASVDIAG